MMTTSVLYWRRIVESVLLGTNPRNRIQRGPLVLYLIVYLKIWLQQTKVVAVRHAHVPNLSTIGPHSIDQKQKCVSPFLQTTKIRIAQFGDGKPHVLPNLQISQMRQWEISGDIFTQQLNT
jgi:hypothetical protein